MVAKVSRKIADPDAIPAGRPGDFAERRIKRALRLHPGRRGLPLQRLGCRHCQETKWVRCRLPALRTRPKAARFGRKIRPIANQHLDVQAGAADTLQVGLELHRRVVACDRRRILLEFAERVAPIRVSLGVFRPERDRPVVACDRRRIAPQSVRRHAEAIKGFRIVRTQRHRRFEARHGGLEPLQIAQGIATIVVCGREIRAQLDRAVVARDGGIVQPQFAQRIAEVVMGNLQIRLQRDGPLVAGDCRRV